MAISLTPEQRDALIAILARGVERVQVGDMEVQYARMRDLFAVLGDAVIEEEVVGIVGGGGRTYATFGRD